MGNYGAGRRYAPEKSGNSAFLVTAASRRLSSDATFAGGAVNNNQLPVYSANTVAGAAKVATNQTAYTNTAATLGGQLYSAAATNATGTTLLSALPGLR